MTTTNVPRCMMQQTLVTSSKNIAHLFRYNLLFILFFVRILKLFCENGVDCSVTDVEHNTPMEMAQRAKHHKCANYLRAQQKKVLQKRNLITNSSAAVSIHEFNVREHKMFLFC